MVKKLIGACVGLAMMGMAGTAHALAFQMEFTATNFSGGAPVDPVSGSITYEAASDTAVVVSFISVDLTIAGHVYTISELGFQFLATTNFTIGGSASGVSGIPGNTDDFRIGWDPTAPTPSLFQYTTLDTGPLFESVTFEEFSITPAPEPSTLALFATGLALLGFLGWRRRGVVQVKAV